MHDRDTLLNAHMILENLERVVFWEDNQPAVRILRHAHNYILDLAEELDIDIWS